MQQSQIAKGIFNDQNEFDGSYDWREQENQRALFKHSKIKDLFPVNFLAEKERFFEKKTEYNPHFCYKTIVSPQVISLNVDHEELAMKILSNNKYNPQNLHILSEQEVLSATHSYLQNLGLHEYVEVRLQSDCLSRTSVAFFKEKSVIKLRTPLQYTKISLQGVLNHEVGTHILRRLNHKQNCIRKPTEKGKLIQQGLAAINQLLPEDKPFLFKAALRYLAAIYASKMPFCKLYKNLSKWVKDSNDCWRQCVRVKRGLGNTEQFGGYYKDQSYLIGAIQILKDRKNIDFRKIYYGKLAPEETVSLKFGVLPPFIDDEQKYKYYLKKLDAIAIYNFIE